MHLLLSLAAWPCCYLCVVPLLYSQLNNSFLLSLIFVPPTAPQRRAAREEMRPYLSLLACLWCVLKSTVAVPLTTMDAAKAKEKTSRKQSLRPAAPPFLPWPDDEGVPYTRHPNNKRQHQMDKNDNSDDDDDYLPIALSLTLALARAVGRLGSLDIAKEMYIALLSRQHPFPFCAWQVIFDPQLYTPVLLDTNSVYWLQALHFRTRSDVFRITGRFPQVRYFGFQSYDSAGMPLSSLPDFLVRERPGSTNPFTNLGLSPAHVNSTGHFEIYVTADGNHGYPNELAALREPSLLISTTTILYRLYGTDPSVGGPEAAKQHRWKLWGFVEPPVVAKRVGVKGKGSHKEAEWEVLPPCSQWDLVRVAQEFVAAERKYLFPLPPQDDVCGLYDKVGRDGVVPHMFPYGHLEPRGIHNYVVYTNKDSNYLYWCDSTPRLGDAFVLVLRGTLPRTPAGLYTSPRIADPGAYDARYVSISTVENMAPSDTYQSVYDSELARHFAPPGQEEGKAWDRHYTIVAAVNESLLSSCGCVDDGEGQGVPFAVPESYYFLPFARRGLTSPRLPGLVYREILSRYRVHGEPDGSAAYLQSVCDAGNADCHEAAPLAALSKTVMSEFYPRIEVYGCVPAEEGGAEGEDGGGRKVWKKLN